MRRLAEILSNDENEASLNRIRQYVVRDWKNKDAYTTLVQGLGEDKAAEVLAWEFLRRSVEYGNLYHDLKQSIRKCKAPTLRDMAHPERIQFLYTMSRQISQVFPYGLYSDKIPNLIHRT